MKTINKKIKSAMKTVTEFIGHATIDGRHHNEHSGEFYI